MATNGATPSDPARLPLARSQPGGIMDSCPLPSFRCCICLELLHKPVVLACGHMSCFWCIHKAMHGLHASCCPICRKPFHHFPSICQLLHFLLLKIEPLAYKRREEEVLEEEKCLDCFSPQFLERSMFERVDPEKQSDVGDIGENTEGMASDFHIMLENDFKSRTDKKVCVDDVLCSSCKEMLFQPVVLNCGHVYCESCVSSLVDGPIKCQICQSLHPGGFPNVCLDLDHFLEEQFPTDYAMRKESVQSKQSQGQNCQVSSNAPPTKEENHIPCCWKDGKLVLDEDLPNIHVGVGCDSCGMYPIVGKRYRCKDCKEKMGFDLCEACYGTSSKLPGRFNQQHTPDHTFEVDDSQLLSKMLMLESSLDTAAADFSEY